MIDRVKAYLKLIRIKHYLKNVLIFIPLIFARNFKLHTIKEAIFGFLAFSFMASAIYIINDIKDLKKDKNDPVKCKRPIASGQISSFKAIIVATIMFSLSLTFNYMVTLKSASYSILLIYFSLNLFYSFGLKHKPIIDVLLLSSFYILRIYYGGAVALVTISDLLFLTVTFASLYLTFGKRISELRKSQDPRLVLKYYNEAFLDKFMYLSLALTLVFYALWTIEQHVEYLAFSTLILFAIFLKYSLNVEINGEGDPIEVVTHDKILIGLGFIYILMLFFILK